jgi:amino acid adenylation domain-containing protein
MPINEPLDTRSLSGLVASRAAERPDADALTDGRQRLTWAEYADRTARLAGVLAAHGVGAGDRVGIHLPKSVHSFVAVHAVLRLAAVVVPIDWFAPTAYAGGVLADADVTALLTAASGRRLDGITEAGGCTITIDPTLDATADPAPIADSVPDDPAYIIYTSGSTGRPKGIVHTHASALAYARRAAATYGLTHDDRLANIAPLHFDQSTFELYAAPLVGATVLVVPDAVMRFPASLAELIEREGITVWYSVPYAITQLITRGAIEDRRFDHLRWVLFGGESFPPRAVAAAMCALPAARFSNVYGPAEVNHCTHHHLVEPPTDTEPIPIGLPWDGVDVVLIADDGTEVADEAPGELWVQAPTMMRGYWRRDDLTERSIVRRDGGSWYRTGDLVRRRADGLLVFVGRVDHQVKLRGHRIELEAVDAVLTDHPQVDGCAALIRHGSEGDDDQLLALVYPPPDDSVRRDLVQLARDRLPRYAVPAEIIGVDTLPRTGTGKIDRRAAADLL